MNLVILSHKEVWPSEQAPTGYVTIGGFPFQIDYISRIFEQTTVIVMKREGAIPNGARPLVGHNMRVIALPEPRGQDLQRKLAIFGWLWQHGRFLWQQIRTAEAIHAPIPGDIGLIGIFIALAQGKKLFIRHCGNWLKPLTRIDQFNHWLLEKIAGKRAIVWATGGQPEPPSPSNHAISWIFSTSLTQAEWGGLAQATPWQIGQPLKLVTVGRVTQNKNFQSIIEALPQIQEIVPAVSLHIVGDGNYRPILENQAAELGLQNQVIFHGHLAHEQVLDTLSNAHIFVFPSHSEGFPKAVLEALACGLPVVASNVSVLPMILRGDTGVVLPDNSAKAIGDAIGDLIQQSDRMGQLACNARQRSQQYTLEKWQETIQKKLDQEWYAG